jgi:hypothetical protein
MSAQHGGHLHRHDSMAPGNRGEDVVCSSAPVPDLVNGRTVNRSSNNPRRSAGVPPLPEIAPQNRVSAEPTRADSPPHRERLSAELQALRARLDWIETEIARQERQMREM